MAGPFRLRRGEGASPEPGATTTAETAPGAEAAPTPDADPTAVAGPSPDAPPPFPEGDPAVPAADGDADGPPADTLADEPEPGFVQRGRLRRRLRYVRRAREVALRDLGGLVFDLHRFGRERGDLVERKLAGLSTLDGEMRALESALDERRDTTVLREPGLASCPRCGALHASDAAYCSACGLPVGRGAGLPTGPSLTGPVTALPPGNGVAGASTFVLPPETAGPAPEPEPEPTDALPAARRAAGEPADAEPAAAPDADAAPDEQPTTTP